MDLLKRKRTFAFVIDTIFISVIFSFANNFIKLNLFSIDNGTALFGQNLFLFFIYFTFFEVILRTSTFGKKIIGITLNFKGTSYLNLFKRVILKILSFVLIPYILIYYLFSNKLLILQDVYTKCNTISIK